MSPLSISLVTNLIYIFVRYKFVCRGRDDVVLYKALGFAFPDGEIALLVLKGGEIR